MQIRNLQYNSHDTVDCEIEHPTYGWIPFTADPDDCEEMGRKIYTEIIEGKYGDIAPYVPYVPTDEEKASEIRAERNKLLAELEPQLLRYERQEKLGIKTTDSEAWYLAAIQYAQDLRDVPQQAGFPESVEWPECP